jgi:hypothetical protein
MEPERTLSSRLHVLGPYAPNPCGESTRGGPRVSMQRLRSTAMPASRWQPAAWRTSGHVSASWRGCKRTRWRTWASTQTGRSRRRLPLRLVQTEGCVGGLTGCPVQIRHSASHRRSVAPAGGPVRESQMQSFEDGLPIAIDRLKIHTEDLPSPRALQDAKARLGRPPSSRSPTVGGSDITRAVLYGRSDASWTAWPDKHPWPRRWTQG